MQLLSLKLDLPNSNYSYQSAEHPISVTQPWELGWKMVCKLSIPSERAHSEQLNATSTIEYEAF